MSVLVVFECYLYSVSDARTCGDGICSGHGVCEEITGTVVNTWSLVFAIEGMMGLHVVTTLMNVYQTLVRMMVCVRMVWPCICVPALRST